MEVRESVCVCECHEFRRIIPSKRKKRKKKKKKKKKILKNP